MVIGMGYCGKLGSQTTSVPQGWEQRGPWDGGWHDGRAHALGEPHGVHPAAHGKPVALKMQR